VAHPALSVEVKSRRSIPAWIEDAMKQAEASSTDGRLPVAVLHRQGRQYADALVVCRLGELARMLSDGTAAGRHTAPVSASDGVDEGDVPPATMKPVRDATEGGEHR
jgi:hypothetical protein